MSNQNSSDQIEETHDDDQELGESWISASEDSKRQERPDLNVSETESGVKSETNSQLHSGTVGIGDSDREKADQDANYTPSTEAEARSDLNSDDAPSPQGAEDRQIEYTSPEIGTPAPSRPGQSRPGHENTRPVETSFTAPLTPQSQTEEQTDRVSQPVAAEPDQGHSSDARISEPGRLQPERDDGSTPVSQNSGSEADGETDTASTSDATEEPQEEAEAPASTPPEPAVKEPPQPKPETAANTQGETASAGDQQVEAATVGEQQDEPASADQQQAQHAPADQTEAAPEESDEVQPIAANTDTPQSNMSATSEQVASEGQNDNPSSSQANASPQSDDDAPELSQPAEPTQADTNEAPDGLTLETSTTNLIRNGSFEKFDVNDGRWKPFAEDSSGDWQVSGSAEVWDGLFGIDSSEGEQHVELDSGRDVDALSQTVETRPGHVYDLSMDLRERVQNGTDTVEVYWNGQLVSELNPDSSDWETFEMKVVGTGSDTLEIREAADENDTYGALLDNVSLVEVPDTIAEGVGGAVVGDVTVSDADDTLHDFTVSDDRFEIVDGVLKLKDDVTLDQEQGSQLNIEVTATDGAGESATAMFEVTVADRDTLQGLPTDEANTATQPTMDEVPEQAVVEGSIEGVFVAKYFDVDGSIRQLSDIDWNGTPTHQEGITEIDYKNGHDSFWEGGARDTFGAQIEGQIDVSEAGTYSFTLAADDGAMLFIDGRPVIDNDGVHSFRRETVELELEPGPHAIEVIYFENYGRAGLNLEWDGPGIDGPTNVVASDPDALTGIDGLPVAVSVDLPLDDVPQEVTIEGMPPGFVLTAGDVSAETTGAPLSLDGWDLSQLQITPPLGFEGPVDAEISGNDGFGTTATATLNIEVSDASHAHGAPLIETGFHVEFFEEDSRLSRLEDVDFDATPVAEGLFDQIDFKNSHDSFWEGGAKNQFAARVTGEISIEEGGIYDFRLAADDGARLFINGTEVVENDGLHGFRNRDGEVELEPGIHDIEIRYFENHGRAGLKFDYRGPDTEGGYETVPSHDMPSTDLSGLAHFGVNVDGLDAVSHVVLDGLPAGSWVSDGTNATLVTDGPLDLTDWDVGVMEVTLPDGMAEDVTARIEATGTIFNGAELTRTAEFTIEVELPEGEAEAVDMSLWSDPDHGAGPDQDQSIDDHSAMDEPPEQVEEDRDTGQQDNAYAMEG
ncbi:PA14 domain-containing protein [Actibacterium sp. 188UL27-1]|uniref:PA14 domain-containing protein n=1 Tax=Actibacterium sp. 188UL27-1 TaxID=2786961 RepID=UPI0019578F5E|nr:PA14 domain-containing protein [Actibacterium sp. 188UL27-1]MBM7068660.1 hypothetical protein [Actibacterium sp. 188UL27-1]